jgi:hypothetical protein
LGRVVQRFVYSLCWLLAVLAVLLRTGELLRPLHILANVCYLFVVPYQTAFSYGHTTEFDALYAFGYTLDALVFCFHCVEAKAVWIEMGRWLGDAWLKLRSGGASGADAQEDGPSDAAPVRRPRRASFSGPAPQVRRGRRNTATIREIAAMQAQVQRQKAEQLQMDRMRQLRQLHLLLYVPFDAFLWGTSAQRFIPYVRFSKMLLAPLQVRTGGACARRRRGCARG